MLMYIAEVAVIIFFLAGVVAACRAILEFHGPTAVKMLAVAIILLVISLTLNYVFDVCFDRWSLWDWWVALW